MTNGQRAAETESTGASQGEEVAGQQQGASASEGAKSAQTQKQEVAPQGSSGSVGGAEARIAELQSQIEETQNHISRLTSSYDRKLHEKDQKANELKQELRKQKMQGMDDVERLVFERDVLQEDYQELQNELSSMRQRQEQQAVANEWADAAISAGVPQTAINRSDPQKTLDSTWNAMLGQLKRLSQEGSGDARQQRQQQSTNQQTQQQEAEVTPPDVHTGQGGGTDTGPKSWGTVLKSLNDEQRYGRDDWTREDVLRAARSDQHLRGLVNDIIRSRAESLE